MLGMPTNVIITGPLGSGKTRLAKTLADFSRAVVGMVLVETATSLRTWRDRRQQLLAAHFLIVDDLDPTAPDFSDLLNLVDQRIECGAPTVLLSGLDSEAWAGCQTDPSAERVVRRVLKASRCMGLLVRQSATVGAK